VFWKLKVMINVRKRAKKWQTLVQPFIFISVFFFFSSTSFIPFWKAAQCSVANTFKYKGWCVSLMFYFMGRIKDCLCFVRKCRPIHVIKAQWQKLIPHLHTKDIKSHVIKLTTTQFISVLLISCHQKISQSSKWCLYHQHKALWNFSVNLL
jgi:hypothetical protein